MKKSDISLAAMWSAVVCLLVTVIFVLTGQFGFSVNGDIKLEGAAAPVVGTQVPSTTQPTTVPTTTQPITQAPVQNGNDTVTTTVPSGDTKDDDALPTDAAAILTKYTELMNKAKTDSPGFSKIEWQDIPPEKAQFEGKVFNTLLPLLGNFFKDEETARANPEAKLKGESMEWFPIYHNDKGCLLTDASTIKSATCTEQPDGNVKITIVMNDELNSEPPAAGAASCASAVGSICTPIEIATVKDTLQNDGAVKFIIRNVEFDLVYHDCTVEMVYNPANDQIVSLDQFMHLTIDIKDGTVVGASAVGKAELDNYMYINNFQY
ncbi:MAG: hypothetical protein IJW86_09395 [Clostridia bacterium]|nr:hypothetical protein [Clostridia bacterium]